MKTQTIRTHHIESAKYSSSTNFSTIVYTLKARGYIKNFRDPFIDSVIKLKRLFNNPKQRFKLQVGGIDFICESCLKRINKTCNPEGPIKNLAPAFADGNYSHDMKDNLTIKDFGLDKKKTYTSKQLRKIFNF